MTAREEMRQHAAEHQSLWLSAAKGDTTDNNGYSRRGWVVCLYCEGMRNGIDYGVARWFFSVASEALAFIDWASTRYGHVHASGAMAGRLALWSCGADERALGDERDTYQNAW